MEIQTDNKDDLKISFGLPFALQTALSPLSLSQLIYAQKMHFPSQGKFAGIDFCPLVGARTSQYAVPAHRQSRQRACKFARKCP